MQWKIILLLVAVNLLYVGLGGVIFHYIEFPNANPQTQSGPNRTPYRKSTELFLLSQYRQYLSVAISNKSDISIDSSDLDRIIDILIAASEYESPSTMNDSSSSSTPWDFPSSIFFASTVVTTIGYGHISPKTDGGRAFCVCYALLGIPLTLVMLAGLGYRLSYASKRLDRRLNFGILSPRAGQAIRTSFIFLLGFSFFVLCPSAMFMSMEEWSYGTAVYYSFITLLTIGFGDFVAGRSINYSTDWWYSLLIQIWIYLGLAWGATCISAAQEVYGSLTSIDKVGDATSASDQGDAEVKIDGSETAESIPNEGREDDHKESCVSGEQTVASTFI